MKLERYTKKEEIFQEIDKCKEQYNQLMKEADEVGKRQYYGAEDDAQKMRLRASGILTIRVGKLKEKLAELQTEVFPFMDGDNSVPARLTERPAKERMPEPPTMV